MRREQGVRLAALAIAGALLTCLTCCSAGTGSGAATSSASPSGGAGSAPTTAPPTYAGVPEPITAVLVQDGGLKLTTQTLGGGCRRLSLQAKESATDVRLTLTVTRPSGICPPYVTLVEVSTTLHAPLGARHLVDASTGRPITPRSG